MSRGYVVVCPDIWYEVGDPGSGIYDYVVSAVNYFKAKPWVAANRIGLQGHSWGGFEVNYLLTRTNVFACAVSAAGAYAKLIEFVWLRRLFGIVRVRFCRERASYRMGGVLCDSVRRFVQNSPVFAARRVSTPLLMMGNDKDSNVPWEQAVEFFSELRRLEKRVWMLERSSGGPQPCRGERPGLHRPDDRFF